MISHVDHKAATDDVAGPRARFHALATLLLVGFVGGAVAGFGPTRIADVLTGWFEAYVAAQGRMIAATGNRTADGRAEFAILLEAGRDATATEQAFERLAAVRYERRIDLTGWLIVSVEAGDRAALDAVRGVPGVRLVVPNRGLWVCH